jgi:hypothetical protein
MSAKAAALIAEYTAAFKVANTLNEVPNITYSNGWFTFKQPWQYPHKYRFREIEQMRDRLMERAATAKAPVP